MTTDRIKLRDAVSGVTPLSVGTPKGWEYLSRHNNKNHIWLPSKQIVDKFKDIIGDKWGKPSKRISSRIHYDLLQTSIIIDGNYILARGGLCPSGVKLFELEDAKNLTALIERMTA